MKIAIITELFHPHVAGSEKRFFEIGRRLVKHGHEVHVFTIQHKKDLKKEDDVEGIQVHRYAHSKNYITQKSYRSISGVLNYSLITALKLFDSDFDIYYFNQWPMMHSILASPFCSTMIQEWCEIWFEKIVLLEKIHSKITNHHVAVSEFTKNRLISYLNVSPEDVVVIPNGVDFQRYSRGSQDKSWGKIIYIGRIVPHKHIDMLLDAYREVKRTNPETELHIVGDGPLLPMIRKQASLVDDCYVHGFLPEDEMINVLESSWLSILPSEREGSGIVALEAMAAGTPVITVDFPHNALTASCVEKGLVVPPRSDYVSSAIQSLLTNEEAWLKMSENASSFAKQSDWETVTGQMEEYLRRIIEDFR